MTLLAAVEDLPAREMRVGLERKYRVSVEQEAGDRYAYRLRVRVIKPTLPKIEGSKTPDPSLRLEIRLTDYRATLNEQGVSAPFIGGGEMEIDPTGLPHGIDVTGLLGPVWLPVLSFYRPVEEGAFDVSHVSVGSGLELVGKGVLAKKEGKPMIDLNARLTAGAREFGKLNLSTRLDGGGWPERAEGTFISADGTYHLKLERA